MSGYYVVGSGNTGVGTSLMAIGGIYAATIMASSLLIKKPAPGYIPAGWTPPASASGGAIQNVNTESAMKTPQVVTIYRTLALTPNFFTSNYAVIFALKKSICFLVLAFVLNFNLISNRWNGTHFCG